jgi:tRNA pseudouridine38-40 synthase
MQTTGAGRTDAGVHARVFYAHFDSEQEGLDGNDRLVYQLNGKLPDDISVYKIIKVDPDAHARYSALSRTYEYHLVRVKDPFLREFAHAVYGNLDIRQMIEASRLLYDYSDFTSFSRVNHGERTYICRILEADWIIDEHKMIFTITADRFLRNMVRAIVGTLLDVGFGRTSSEGFRMVIESKDRSRAGASAPAKGLFLTDITYPMEIFIT